MQDRTLEELQEQDLNQELYQEMLIIHEYENPIHSSMRYMRNHIEKLRYPTGRKVRKERRESMKTVLNILYDYATMNGGDCFPSMRTIAQSIDPTLEKIQEGDTPTIIKKKEKAMGPTLMLVQRSITALKDFGIIKIHEFRAESNRNDEEELQNLKKPNYYYELTPVSCICASFKAKLQKFTKTIKENINPLGKINDIINSVKETVIFQENFAMITRLAADPNYFKRRGKNAGNYNGQYWADTGIYQQRE